ncbi:hypothetical protein HMPREF1254_1954 [Prevotella sp. BV3P1]|nr:hypothetical protein HMPREF1254_1954 [Prevotella sp. BV3P1]
MQYVALFHATSLLPVHSMSALLLKQREKDSFFKTNNLS